MLDLLKIDETSSIPKYKQIINSVEESIERKILVINQQIPSLNVICKKYNLSRDTVLSAFNELQARGILTSKPGKGYYVAKVTTNQPHRIFMLFDKITPYKEVLHDAFLEELSRSGTVDIYFHHFNLKLFETLIRENLGIYTAYVVMPIPTKTISQFLDLIPKDKLFILDRGRKKFGQTYPSVCQNFKDDVYNALKSGSDLIEKYQRLIMIFPTPSNIPRDIRRGFEGFCKEFKIPFKTIKELHSEKILKNSAYLVFDDRDLVKLVKAAEAHSFTLGKDIGIISYNDTPLKSVVATGITTISTDFAEMGKSMAHLIMNKRKEHLINPTSLIRRNSL